LDLLDPVLLPEGRKDRFIVSGQKKLQAPFGYELSHSIQVGDVVGLQPVQERSGQVEREGKKSSLDGLVEEGSVDLLQMLLEDVAEVAYRLMGVEPKRQIYWVIHQNSEGSV
jgi:hypothetical protein